MARIIIHEAKEPVEVKCGSESKFVCACGLTKNKPFCDGSHLKTQSEEDGKVYKYEGEEREEVDL